MRHLGFASAACYRLSGRLLVQTMGTATKPGEAAWPAATDISWSDYTASQADPTHAAALPLGWIRPIKGIKAQPRWPKSAFLYFPDQELENDQLVFAVVCPSGKRLKVNELVGALEALAARVRSLLADQATRRAVSETALAEHARILAVDLRMLLDHELRTPLASVVGYSTVLRGLDQQQSGELWEECWSVLENEVGNAVAAVDKLSLALAPSREALAEGELTAFDAAEDVQRLCREMEEGAADFVGAEMARRVHIQFLRASDQSCLVMASPRLFRWALWEVLKNAVIHARSGRVDVKVYYGGGALVIDIEDDGAGVSPGAEELIFLRFYQDPGSLHLRRGKRGLGLGLFLARHIAERHLGQLTFIRQKGGSVFRFIWPLAATTVADQERSLGSA